LLRTLHGLLNALEWLSEQKDGPPLWN